MNPKMKVRRTMIKLKINGRILEFHEDNITLDLIDCNSICLGEVATEKVALNFNVKGNVNIAGNFYNNGDFKILGDLINDGGFYNSGHFICGKFNVNKKSRPKKSSQGVISPNDKDNNLTITLRGKTINVPRSQG